MAWECGKRGIAGERANYIIPIPMRFCSKFITRSSRAASSYTRGSESTGGSLPGRSRLGAAPSPRYGAGHASRRRSHGRLTGETRSRNLEDNEDKDLGSPGMKITFIGGPTAVLEVTGL